MLKMLIISKIVIVLGIHNPMSFTVFVLVFVNIKRRHKLLVFWLLHF